MKIISLKNKELDFFKGFDPFEILDREDIKPKIKLGAVFEGAGGDIPAGLMLAMPKESDLIILWLFVVGSFRRRGFAERLLSVAFRYAKETGLRQVTAVFPGEYGRDLVCRGDRVFFTDHGFVELKKGIMTASVADYEKYTAYGGPSLEDEGLSIYALFDDMEPENYMKAEEAKEAKEAEEGKKEFPGVVHKSWVTKELKLKDFAGLPSLKNTGPRFQEELRESRIKIGGIGDLPLSGFKQGIELCTKNNHTGFIENLYETPPDYFDPVASSYVSVDGEIKGLLLVHSNEPERVILAELLFVTGADYVKALLALLRYGIVAAMERYSLETKVILPYDEKLHRPLVEKLFGRPL